MYNTKVKRIMGIKDAAEGIPAMVLHGDSYTCEHNMWTCRVSVVYLKPM